VGRGLRRLVEYGRRARSTREAVSARSGEANVALMGTSPSLLDPILEPDPDRRPAVQFALRWCAVDQEPTLSEHLFDFKLID
jgi:hypothetical protein